jgi:hypothetical protein
MKKFTRLPELAILALFVLLTQGATRLDAQSTFGSLRGLTLDATGSAVPAAEITLQGLDDNSEHKTVSGEDGVFEFENLKPGHYRVVGHKPGFADALVPQLALEARQDLRVNLSLLSRQSIPDGRGQRRCRANQH